MWTQTRCRAKAACLMGCLVLSGCGGGQDDALPELLLARATVLSPLLDDAGGVGAGDPTALPAEPAARARLARHATAAQAAQVEAAMGAASIPLQLAAGADAVQATEQALAQTAALQWEHHLDSDAPVFVRGPEPQLAAAVADGLAARGHTRVFVVAP